jgi:superfamily II helicase
MFSQRGDVVLDPFLGLGTTTLAAILSERNSIGYEIDHKLHDILRNIISQFDVNKANAIINGRYLKHLTFITERECNKKEVKHFNEKLGCKVMTGQESDLIFHFIDEVKETLNTPEKLSFVSYYLPTLDLATPPIKMLEGLFAN